MPVPALAALLVFAPMIAEAVISTRHDRSLRALGALEPPGDVYRQMQLAYPGCFVLMLVEGALRHVGWDPLVVSGVAVFVVAKGLKYWAMASLGMRWTFRVLVPRGSSRVQDGPYRWLRHPNYVAVAGELIAVAIAMHAAITGPVAVAGFGVLMWRRIGVEENALAAE